MGHGNRLARLFRVLSGESQRGFAEKANLYYVLIADYERGAANPPPEHLERMARAAELTVAAGERILGYAETQRQPRQRGGEGREALQARFAPIAALFEERLLRAPRPEEPPREEDRLQARDLAPLLAELPEGELLAVARLAPEVRSWAFVEHACEESARQASRDLDRAAAWARFAEQVAARLTGPEGWLLRVRGFAAAHAANVLRVKGELEAADAALAAAKRRWHAGEDPEGLLDPGRLLDLEASLRRAQRGFVEALQILDEARKVSRCPGRILVKKGFTLEVMGEYERAVETLLEAEPLVEREGDPRLRSLLRLNLAINLTHLGRPAEAARLVAEAKPLARELGDEINLIRITWLEGRIAGGFGRPEEARSLLAEARRAFAELGMSYNVALALLEEAALLLEEGRAAEVKALAPELARVFEGKGVHREALAALRLFREAAEREAASAGLARRVLGFLFRARHDPGLRFSAS
jgi:transcriptional regulator with XRE-family HTH domain